MNSEAMEARINGGVIGIAIKIAVCAAVLFLGGCAGTTKIK